MRNPKPGEEINGTIGQKEIRGNSRYLNGVGVKGVYSWIPNSKGVFGSSRHPETEPTCARAPLASLPTPDSEEPFSFDTQRKTSYALTQKKGVLID